MRLKPKYYSIKTGKASAKNELNSLDKAFLAAGIGDYNIIEISSILPKDCKYKEKLTQKPPGTLLPCVISSYTSSKKNRLISSAITVGETEEGLKVVSEANGALNKQESERRSENRAVKMIKNRKMNVRELITNSVEEKVKDTTSVVTAAVVGGFGD